MRLKPDRGPRGILWDAQPLGRVADRVLARRLGVSGPAVYTARRARGIANRRGFAPAPICVCVSPALLDYTVAVLGWYPVTFRVVYERILNEYGSLSERQLYRALARLQHEHRVIKTVDGYRQSRRGDSSA